MKSALAIILCLMMISCGPGNLSVLKEGPGPEASPEAREGWQDGCQSGLSAYGSDLYKTLYSFKQNGALIGNKVYYNTWKDSYDYCRHWINQYLKQGLLGQEYSDDLRDPRAAKEGSGVMPPFLGW